MLFWSKSFSTSLNGRNLTYTFISVEWFGFVSDNWDKRDNVFEYFNFFFMVFFTFFSSSLSLKFFSFIFDISFELFVWIFSDFFKYLSDFALFNVLAFFILFVGEFDFKKSSVLKL